MEPNTEEILEALNASGYLFEQEVASVFEKNNFHIYTNTAYKDEDEEKSREIDVMAFRQQFYNKEKQISISVRIICECKNNTNPFVFICRNKNASDSNYSPPNFNFPQKEYKIPIEGNLNSFYFVTGFKYYQIQEIFPYHLNDYKAVQFCKIVRKGKEWHALQEGIYDSILLPIFKCLEYFKSLDNQQNNSSWENYIIYFPIIVLNSSIYLVKTHLKPINLIKTPHISFTRDIHSKRMKGKYLVDFVSLEYLDNYLEHIVTKFVDNFINIVVK
ncbi:hypothetical protein [Spirosoma litoris]